MLRPYILYQHKLFPDSNNNLVPYNNSDGTEVLRAITVIVGMGIPVDYPGSGYGVNVLSQRDLDIILALGKVELAFLGQPTQCTVHLVHFELCSFTQFLQGQRLMGVNE